MLFRSGKRAVMDEGTQQVLFALQGASVVACRLGQLFGIEAGVVGQRILFEITPGVFDGVQFRCVGRQEDGMRSEERRVGKECRSRWSPYH